MSLKVRDAYGDLHGIAGQISTDDILSTTSGNAISNRAVTNALADKITEPANDGSNGQVLTTNGSGVRTWTTIISSSALSDLTDVNLSSVSDGEVLKYDATSSKWVNGTGGGGGSSATFLSQTLVAGNTSVTFTNIPTTGNYVVDFFSSDGSSFISMNTSVSGQVTLIYNIHSSDITIYCRIEEVVIV